MRSTPRFLVLAATLLFAALASPCVQAQDVQVAFDEERGVSVIGADLRAQLGLFPGVEGFREARLFRSEDGAYELVVRYEEEAGARVLRERRALTAEEAEALRRRVRTALAATEAPERVADARASLEDGRYRFLAATTTLGAVNASLLAGAGLLENEEGLLAAALLGGTGGFFVPLLLTRDAKVTVAEATLAGYGGLQGVSHGLQLVRLFSGDDDPGQGALALLGMLSIAEATAGFQVARRTNMRGGTAEAMSYGGLFGSGLGTAAAALVVGSRERQREFENVTVTTGEGPSLRALALGQLLGSGLGIYGGYRLARAASYTQGDARAFGTTGLLGTLVSNAALALAGSYPGENDRLTGGINLAGTLGGLALGHKLVQGRDLSDAEGNIAFLGALAGGLAGGAVSVITDAGENAAITLTTLGAVGGFGATLLTLGGSAQPATGDAGAFDLDVGLGSGAALPGGSGGPLGDLAPALNVRLGF